MFSLFGRRYPANKQSRWQAACLSSRRAAAIHLTQIIFIIDQFFLSPLSLSRKQLWYTLNHNRTGSPIIQPIFCLLRPVDSIRDADSRWLSINSRCTRALQLHKYLTGWFEKPLRSERCVKANQSSKSHKLYRCLSVNRYRWPTCLYVLNHVLVVGAAFPAIRC